MKKERTNIAVLVSGGGTKPSTSGRITLVISNSRSAYALKRAEAAGIKAVCITKAEFGGSEGMEKELVRVLEEEKIDLIVLAGFMSILSADFTRRFERRIINIHPSLIPSFCGSGYYGLKVHEAALKKGVKVTGATVHFVNEIPGSSAANALTGSKLSVMTSAIKTAISLLFMLSSPYIISFRSPGWARLSPGAESVSI